MKIVVSFVLSLSLCGLTLGAKTTVCNDEELSTHPVLCEMAQLAENEPEAAAKILHDWASTHGLLVDFAGESPLEKKVSLQLTSESVIASPKRYLKAKSEQLPVVFAHGMGDSCFNSGMQHITDKVSEILGGVYCTCVPTGASQSEDTTNGYFLDMVDIFAEAIQKDPELRGGFHAIGFSQGNNVIRGYIARYNSPAVNTFLAVNGVNAGIGAVPYCRPELLTAHQAFSLSFSMCDLLMEQASHRAYTDFCQKHSFQANYWRDPRPSMADMYHQYAQLAVWGNEGPTHNNKTLNSNYARTEKFVWVLATEDGMVWPKEGEQWGAPDPQNPFIHILPMRDTAWYQDDSFGLRTADELGKNHFESFQGDHLQFEMKDFERWVLTYLTAKG